LPVNIKTGIADMPLERRVCPRAAERRQARCGDGGSSSVAQVCHERDARCCTAVEVLSWPLADMTEDGSNVRFRG
jgi:hypothetical protein